MGDLNMMHKEIVAKKKAPVIGIALFVITFMLYAQEALKIIDFSSRKTLLLCKLIIALIAVLVIIREFLKCKVSYKYALIANKLIVNKIFSNDEKNLTSIKISDIVYLGKKGKQPKNIEAKLVGSYGCNKLKFEQCCCIYKVDNNYYKFYFQPSECFINRVKRNILKLRDNKLLK